MDKNKKQILGKLLGYGFFALMILAIISVRFLYGSVIGVSGQSMFPTFNDTDYVFATVLHDDDELNVGDIVIIEENGVYLIKRIYGLPGETITPDYVKNIPEITLGDDEYYVLGDNWQVSRDSRMFGPVSRDRIAFKYANIHWTRGGMIISLLIPAMLFIAQLSIVFIPADKKKRIITANEVCDEVEMTDPDYVDEDVLTSTGYIAETELTLEDNTVAPNEHVHDTEPTVH